VTRGRLNDQNERERELRGGWTGGRSPGGRRSSGPGGGRTVVDPRRSRRPSTRTKKSLARDGENPEACARYGRSRTSRANPDPHGWKKCVVPRITRGVRCRGDYGAHAEARAGVPCGAIGRFVMRFGAASLRFARWRRARRLARRVRRGIAHRGVPRRFETVRAPDLLIGERVLRPWTPRPWRRRSPRAARTRARAPSNARSPPPFATIPGGWTCRRCFISAPGSASRFPRSSPA